MENKKEINLEDFMSNSWDRLKQLIFAQSSNLKETENPVEEDNDKIEEVEDQDENDDESEPETVEDETKYTDAEELDESQYDEETKLIVESNG
jgi:hypothetical protein